MKIYLVVWQDEDGRDYRFVQTHSGMRALIGQIVAKGGSTTILREQEITMPVDRAGMVAFLNGFEITIGKSLDELVE